MRTIRAAILSTAAALVVCGAGTAGGAVASSLHAGKQTVKAKEVNSKYLFGPKHVSVAVGTKVVWKNTTDAAHTVTFKSMSFDKKLATGKRLSFTFTKPGTYAYYCKYHPGMVGTIVVK